MPHIWVPPSSARQNKWKKTSGKTLGMGVCAWFCMVFEANEKLDKSKKLTDDMIAQMLVEEYPDHPRSLKYLSPGVPTVNQMRGRYNRGEFSPRDPSTGELVPPKIISFRYNEDGRKVNGRTGSKLLTPYQESAILLRYSKADSSR